MNKKNIILFFLLVLTVVPLFSDITDYSKGTKSTQNFTLMLNKSGVNKIYFADKSVDSEGNPVSVAISNNRHIFPILGEDSNGTKVTSIKDSMYFFWELDDAAGATINLKFVSSDADFETGYMLDDVSSTTGLDFNYNVTVYSEDTTSVVGTPISVTAATVLQTKTLVERTIQVFSSGGSNNSYVTISMEVIAPIWEDGGTAAFMDAQYAGYIVAELKFT